MPVKSYPENNLCPFIHESFPGGSEGKASACKAGDLGLIPGCGRSPGEGNGNPLQYSCLENPMDRVAWWATVHGVAKSRTRQSDFTFFYSFSMFLVLQLCMLSSEDWKERTIAPGFIERKGFKLLLQGWALIRRQFPKETYFVNINDSAHIRNIFEPSQLLYQRQAHDVCFLMSNP